MIKKFRDMDSDGMEDHGKYYMSGNIYIPKKQETEYKHFTEDIKNDGKYID